MKPTYFIPVAVVFCLTAVCTGLKENGKLWGVLVAGSNGYYNYRHQADICHSYQILHKHGIPDEQIIVMMYDDIAYDEQNPTPGVIINRPNGTNVYPGVPKDYVGEHVTPETFLNVLLGKSESLRGIGSGKVLKSGPNDHVFINFADHGAPGLLAFPNGELLVSDFMKTLNKMHENKMYEKMVIYVEACESGSMFAKQLPDNINIYATTAANSKESSYACYFDDERQTYLGDVYSVKWMEDSDLENLLVETLNKQFKIVKAETNTSHVMHYGNLTIGKLHVGEFQGMADVAIDNHWRPKLPYDAVPSPDVPMHILERKLRTTPRNDEKFMDLQRTLRKFHSNRQFLDNQVKEIIKKSVEDADKLNIVLNERMDLKNLKCYESVVKYFSKHCFSLSKNDYALRYMYMFVNMCEMGISPKKIKKAMDVKCTYPPIYGIH